MADQPTKRTLSDIRPPSAATRPAPKPEPKAKAKATPKAVAPAPAQPAAVAAPKPTKPKSKLWTSILTGLVILILSLAVLGAYYYFFVKQA